MNAPRGLFGRLRELTSYPYLISNLVVRNLKIRYKNSLLGIAWSMLNPLLMMVVFTVVFTLLAGGLEVAAPSVFFLAGLLPWNFFAQTIPVATNCIVQSDHLIKKVYFPREAIPLAVMLSNLVHFVTALPIFFGLALLMGIPGVEHGSYLPHLLWLPLIVLIEAVFIFGFSLITATVNVFYRDMGIVMETIIQAWFFVTPVFWDFRTTLAATYPILGVDVRVDRWARILNPMASIVEAYRDVLYFGNSPNLPFLLRTALTALLVLVVGYWFFQRYNWRFGEEL